MMVYFSPSWPGQYRRGTQVSTVWLCLRDHCLALLAMQLVFTKVERKKGNNSCVSSVVIPGIEDGVVPRVKLWNLPFQLFVDVLGSTNEPDWTQTSTVFLESIDSGADNFGVALDFRKKPTFNDYLFLTRSCTLKSLIIVPVLLKKPTKISCGTHFFLRYYWR